MRTLILIVAIVAIVAVAAGAQEKPVIPEIDTWTTYKRHSNVQWSVSWDRSPHSGVIEYEYALYNMERDSFFLRGRIPQPPAGTHPKVTLTVLRAGHYIFFCRALTDTQQSDWADSINMAKDGQSWWIYTYLAPVGPMQIQ